MNKISKFKLKHNVVISFILSCLIIISFSKQDLIINYNLFSIISLISIFYLIYKTRFKLESKKNYYILVFLAILYSIFMIIGRNALTFAYNKEVNIISGIFSLYSLFHFVSYFVLFYSMLEHIITYSLSINSCSKNNLNNKKLFTVFFLCLSLIMTLWMPYFLTLYPGGVSPDSISEIQSIQNGVITSDHHPVAHQLFMLIFYNLGFKIFGSVNAAVATISFVQMIVMASIFSYVIIFLLKNGINKKILMGVLLFYGFSPIFGYYSVTMWKDVLFGGFMVLFTISIIKVVEYSRNNENISLKKMLPMFITSLLVIFFRNNAIYMYLIFIPFAIITFKKFRKKFVLLFISVISIFIVVKYPVYNFFNISRSESSEYIGIPLQQIGRMAFKNVQFSKNEEKYLNGLIPIYVMRNAYNPQVSDGIKFNSNYNSKYFDNNKVEFFKTYAKLVFKYPAIAVESYFVSTVGYYYPNFMNWSVANNVWENDIGIYSEPKAPKFVQNYVTNVESRDLPIISMQWSIGLCFWIILFSAALLLMKTNFKNLIIYVPIFGIWITMMIASPVWGEFRYVFSAFTLLPLLLSIPYTNINIVNNKKSKSNLKSKEFKNEKK